MIPDFRDNGRAITAMLVANAGFLINDTLVKIVSATMPLGQIIFLRGLVTIALMLGVCWMLGVFSRLKYLIQINVLLRTCAEVAATFLYLSALTRMPIANATSILQALPLVVTAGAAVFLGSPVGWRRWTAIAIGLFGVLLIVRPGFEGFNTWSLVAFCGVFAMAARDLMTRRIPQEVPTLVVSLATAVGVTVFGAGLSVSEVWQPVGLADMARLAGAAGFILVGYVSIVLAMRGGDISLVAPFRYSAVLWALLLGYIVWGEIPDAWTVAGTFVVVITGIYTFLRERHLTGLSKRVE